MSDPRADADSKRIKAINHIGEYQIHRVLGTGTQGKVYKASSDKDERLAIKVLSRGLAKERASIESFEENAAAAADLSHPHIVPVHEIGQYKGRYYYTMDYVQGRNLRDYITVMGRLSPDAALSLLRQAAKALDYANARNVAHGHLTPGNALITNDGTLKLTDFGSAGGQPVHNAEETHQELPQDGEGKTLLEDDFSPGNLKSKDDMLSLGVMFYEMLSGRLLDDAKHKVALSDEKVGKVPTEFRPLLSQLAGKNPTIENPADLLRSLDFFGEESAAIESASLDANVPDKKSNVADKKSDDHDTKPLRQSDPEQDLKTMDVIPGAKLPPIETPVPKKTTAEKAKPETTVREKHSQPETTVREKHSQIGVWFKRIAIAATASSVILLVYGLVFSKRAVTPPKKVDTVAVKEQPAPVDDQPGTEEPASDSSSKEVADDTEETEGEEVEKPDGEDNEEAEGEENVEEVVAGGEEPEQAEGEKEDPEPAVEDDPEIAPTDPLDDEEETEVVAVADVPDPSVPVTQPVEVKATWRPHAARLAKLLATRKYEPALEILDKAAGSGALNESARRWRSYVEEGVQFWEKTARGARKAAGAEFSLTVKAGAGTIQMEGKIEGVNDEALLSITAAGMEYTCGVRELLLDDALSLANRIESTSDLTRGILLTLDLQFDEAAQIFKASAGSNETASKALSDINDPAGLAQQMLKASRGASLKALIASAKAKAREGNTSGAAQMLRKEMERWAGTSEADVLQQAIDQLPTPALKPTPTADGADEKLWKKIEGAVKKEQWKELLAMAKTFEKRHGKSQIMELKGDQLEEHKVAAEIGLSIGFAKRADAALEQSVPGHNPPRVLTVAAGKGDKAIGDAIGKRASGIVVIGKGEFLEQAGIKGKRGTAENPFAIIGVPGGKTILSSLKDVKSRPGKDAGTVWIPWMDRPPRAALMQGRQPLKATRSAPSEPGSYFIDQKAKRCLIVPYPGEEQPTIRVPVLTGGCTFSVDSTPHLLIRDVAFEQPAAAVKVKNGTRTLTLQRVTTWQQGAMDLESTQVMVKDSIITTPVSIQTDRLFASNSVFGSVKLTSLEPGAEVVFDNCMILGGIQSTVPNPKRIEFRQCTFIGCSTALDLEKGTNVLIIDSIFTRVSESAVLLQKAGGAYQLKNVLMWQNGADFGGVAPESKVIALSPMFQAAEFDDLRLKKDSPCKGKASNKKDIGLNWSDTQWGRWLRFLKAHHAEGILSG
jgi:serine/threonine protein kinase